MLLSCEATMKAPPRTQQTVEPNPVPKFLVHSSAWPWFSFPVSVIVPFLRDEGISPMPNPQSGRPGCFCRGFLPLASKTPFFEHAGYSPFARGYSESAFPGVTRTCDMPLGGRAYNPVGIPLKRCFWCPSVPRRGSLPLA